MLKAIDRVVTAWETAVEWSGEIFIWLVVPIFVVMMMETVSRYLFARPLSFTYDTVVLTFGAYAVLGGAWCLLHGAHVAVDILETRLKKSNPRRMALIRVLTSPLALLFLGALVWQGYSMASTSVALWERSSFTPFHAPIWPLKVVMLIGAFMLLLEGIARLYRDLVTVIKGANVK